MGAGGVLGGVAPRLVGFDPGSDLAAEGWRERYRIEGVEERQLHHLYRTMKKDPQKIFMNASFSIYNTLFEFVKPLLSTESVGRSFLQEDLLSQLPST